LQSVSQELIITSSSRVAGVLQSVSQELIITSSSHQ